MRCLGTAGFVIKTIRSDKCYDNDAACWGFEACSILNCTAWVRRRSSSDQAGQILKLKNTRCPAAHGFHLNVSWCLEWFPINIQHINRPGCISNYLRFNFGFPCPAEQTLSFCLNNSKRTENPAECCNNNNNNTLVHETYIDFSAIGWKVPLYSPGYNEPTLKFDRILFLFDNFS